MVELPRPDEDLQSPSWANEEFERDSVLPWIDPLIEHHESPETITKKKKKKKKPRKKKPQGKELTDNACINGDLQNPESNSGHKEVILDSQLSNPVLGSSGSTEKIKNKKRKPRNRKSKTTNVSVGNDIQNPEGDSGHTERILEPHLSSPVIGSSNSTENNKKKWKPRKRKPKTSNVLVKEDFQNTEREAEYEEKKPNPLLDNNEEGSHSTPRKSKKTTRKTKPKENRSKRDDQSRPNQHRVTPYQGRRRTMGRFRCEECEKEWLSANSWANCFQTCKECKRPIYPCAQFPPERRKGKQRKRKIAHPMNMCQKCQLLGYSCVDYDSEEEEEDDSYDD